MGRRLLLALIAAFAMLAASCVAFLAIAVAPRIADINLLPDSSATKQERARLALRLQEGFSSRSDGDYDRAAAAFGEVAGAKPDLADVKEAQFQLGQTYVLSHSLQSAASTLQRFYDQYPEDARHDEVAFTLGTVYRELKQTDKAVSLLGDYAKQSRASDPYVRYQLGLAYRDAGNFSLAIEEFSKALTGEGLRLFEIDVMEQIADAYLRLKQYDDAAMWYEKIRPRAVSDAYKSELNYRVAAAYGSAGRTSEARSLFLANIASYPSTYYAALSLDEVDKLDPNAVGYYQEGVVSYLNGRYEKAVTSFGQLLANPQDKNAGDALYFQGLAYQKLGNQAQAIARFDQVMRGYPSSSRVGSAWFQKAESQVRAKSYNDAIATYRQFATALPLHEQAQEARWEAAQLLETLQRFEEARREYATLLQTYPSGRYAEDAVFRQGLTYFKERQYDKATQVWDTYLKTFPNAEQKPRGAFWAGKSALMAGKTAEAAKFFEQAIQATPDEYYGFRAKVVTQTATTNLSIAGLKQTMLAPDSESDRHNTIDWLGRWVSTPPTIGVFSTITITVQEDAGFKRGEELLKLGLKKEAADEFWEVSNRFRTDGVTQLQLSLFFRDQELYQQSIGAAQRVAALSREKSYLNLPRLLLRLMYPPYYANLVLTEAERGSFDPLVLFSLILQESAFNKDALSPAEARGLTQVIPDTGEWLAQKLGLASFRLDDLDKPYVSVRFGATYLSGVLSQFDGNVFFALAGYNGGPGNDARWSNNNPKYDVDLFAEDIDYSETRRYVKIVVENYEMYKFVYGTAPVQ